MAEVQANSAKEGRSSEEKAESTFDPLLEREKDKTEIMGTTDNCYSFPAQQANKLRLVPPNFIQGNIPLMECF